MNTFVRILIVGMLSVILIPNFGYAQNKKEKAQETKTVPAVDDQRMNPEGMLTEGFILIKAVEIEFGRFDLRINAGLDKEGNERRFAANGKEEERMNRVLESRSLVNLLNIMHKMGYQIESSYSVVAKDEIVHYYLMTNMKEEINMDSDQPNDQVGDPRRANQNRPKLSPEEIEKRKKAREGQDK